MKKQILFILSMFLITPYSYSGKKQKKLFSLFKNTLTYPEIVEFFLKKHNLDFRRSIPGKKIHPGIFYLYFKYRKELIDQKKLINAINKAKKVICFVMANSNWSDNYYINKDEFDNSNIYEWKYEELDPNIEYQNHTVSKITYKKDSGYFPFKKKLHLDSEEKAVIISDIHGDIKGFLTALLPHLKKNTFSLKNDRHIICLGDIVNSGPYSAEIIYFLAKLITHNPSNIHIIRGNNDVPNKTIGGGFLDELFTKYPNIKEKDINTIYSFFDLFPELLVTVPKEIKIKDCMLISHSGLQPGDDISSFLLNENATFAQIGYRQEDGKLIIPCKDIIEEFNQELQDIIENAEKESGKHVFCNYKPTCPDTGSCECTTDLKKEFRVLYHATNIEVNDFYNKKKNNDVIKIFYGIVCKNPFLKTIIKKIKRSSGYEIKAFFRGHQHSQTTEDYNNFKISEDSYKNKGLSTKYITQNYPIITVAPLPGNATGLATPNTLHSNHDNFEKEYLHNPGNIYLNTPIISVDKNKNLDWKNNVNTSILPKEYVNQHYFYMEENEIIKIKNKTT